MKRDRRAESKVYYFSHKEKWNTDKANKLREKWRLDNPSYSREYYLSHREEVLLKDKKRRVLYPEKARAKHTKYYISEKGKQNHEKYYLTHREQIRGRQQKYTRTPKGKEAARKNYSKRKHFKFIPLNKYFLGAEAHHINTERIIYIPKTLHRSIIHSVSKNRSMDKINKAAYEFLGSNV